MLDAALYRCVIDAKYELLLPLLEKGANPEKPQQKGRKSFSTALLEAAGAAPSSVLEILSKKVCACQFVTW